MEDCPFLAVVLPATVPQPEAPKRRSVAHAMQTVINGNPSGSGGGTGSETGREKSGFPLL